MKRTLLELTFFLVASSVAIAQVAKPAPVKLEGQVVCCEDCWGKADRKSVTYGTRADLTKAVQCVASGDPTLLAVAKNNGEFTLYQLDLGTFQRPGKNWLEYVGKRVQVIGFSGKKKNKPYIKVDELTVLAPAAAESEPEVNPVGAQAQLTMKDLFGVEQRLSSYLGRIVVLNFWATYCVPCRKEMPDLTLIQNQYAALGLQVIGASADPIEDKKKIMQFIKETKLNFPIWLGASAEDMTRFGLGADLPGTVVIGRDGRITAAFKGVIDPSELKKHLETLLAAAEKVAKREIAAARKGSNKASSVPS